MNNYREEGRSMRPNHQNKRMRGRNRSNGGGGGGGKGPNPLTRSYESNGPDVKVRGTAQNIAEKYVQLGRDAQATGDHVAAESFFQHAEHYFRLIAAAQEQFRIANPGFRGFDQPEADGEEGEEEGSFGQGQGQAETRAFGQGASEGEEEPQGEFQPREQSYQPRDNRDQRGPRPPRDNRNFQPREQREPRDAPAGGDFQPREPREFQPREQRDQRPPRDFQPREQREFQPREQRDQRPPREGGRYERGGPDRRFPRNEPMPIEAEQPGLPSFITAPVRNTVASETPIEPVFVETAVPVDPTFVEPVGVRRRGRPPKVQAPDVAPDGE